MFLTIQKIELIVRERKAVVTSSTAPAKVTTVATFRLGSRSLMAHTLILSPTAYLSMSVAMNL